MGDVVAWTARREHEDDVIDEGNAAFGTHRSTQPQQQIIFKVPKTATGPLVFQASVWKGGAKLENAAGSPVTVRALLPCSIWYKMNQDGMLKMRCYQNETDECYVDDAHMCSRRCFVAHNSDR